MVAALAGFLLVVAFGVGNIWRWSFFSPEVRISVLDGVVFVLILAFGLWGLKQYSRLIKLISIFAGVGAVSLLLAARNYGLQNTLVGGLYLLRWVIYSLFFVASVRLFKAQEMSKLLLILGMVVVLTGLVQYAFWPDVRALEILEWDPHYFRVVGSWLDPGFTGLLLVFTLVYLTINPLRHLLIQRVIWALSYLTFALTYSRSSYLAFLVGMGWIAIKRKSWQFFAKAAVLLLATIVLLPRAPDGEGVKLERTNSIQARIDSWSQALTIWQANPLLGVGFNTYRYASGASLSSHAGAGADSSLLFVLATTGVVGLGVYLWYLKRLFSLKPITYYLIPLLVHSLFLNSLFYPAVMLWLALIVAATGLKPR